MDALALMFLTVSQTFSLPPGLLSSICFVESSHRVTAHSPNDGGTPSVGICQVKLQTAKGMGFKGNVVELFKPKMNIFYAGKYLAYQLELYDGDPRKAVAAYNAGRWRLNDEGRIKNRKYVSKVFQAWSEGK